jgi:biofilm PGA synthesis N-glycosyltransferase PgaC
MMPVLSISLILLAMGYIAVLVRFTIGMNRMNYPAASSGVSKIKTLNAPRGGELDPCPPLAGLKPGTQSQQPGVSVVIAARNEEGNISACLSGLASQDYPSDNYEVIVVNDRSTDRTEKRIKAFVQRDARFRLVNVTEINPHMAPKKWALETGIRQARGEIILTTDADCLVRPGWISAIVRCFEDDVGLVAGFSPLEDTSAPSLLHRLIALDALAIAAIAAGSFGIDHPLTCTGRNLAYRKSVFREIGGFGAIGRFVSGDDDLFLHEVRKKTDWKCRYAVDPESIVPSKPPATWSTFFSQRTRHASKGRHYDAVLKIGLVAFYLMNALLFISAILIRLRPLFIGVFFAKSLLEFVLIRKASLLFDRQKALIVFPIAVLIHPLYILVFGFWGQFGKFKWKEKTYKARME